MTWVTEQRVRLLQQVIRHSPTHHDNIYVYVTTEIGRALNIKYLTFAFVLHPVTPSQLHSHSGIAQLQATWVATYRRERGREGRDSYLQAGEKRRGAEGREGRDKAGTGVGTSCRCGKQIYNTDYSVSRLPGQGLQRARTAGRLSRTNKCCCLLDVKTMRHKQRRNPRMHRETRTGETGNKQVHIFGVYPSFLREGGGVGGICKECIKGTSPAAPKNMLFLSCYIYLLWEGRRGCGRVGQAGAGSGWGVL